MFGDADSAGRDVFKRRCSRPSSTRIWSGRVRQVDVRQRCPTDHGPLIGPRLIRADRDFRAGRVAGDRPRVASARARAPRSRDRAGRGQRRPRVRNASKIPSVVHETAHLRHDRRARRAGVGAALPEPRPGGEDAQTLRRRHRPRPRGIRRGAGGAASAASVRSASLAVGRSTGSVADTRDQPAQIRRARCRGWR